jgi:hypothetical protein
LHNLTTFDAIPDRAISQIIHQIKSMDEVTAVLSDSRFTSATELLLNHRDLLVEHILRPNNFDAGSGDLCNFRRNLMVLLQNAREVVKSFLMSLWRLKSTNTITEIDARKIVEIHKDAIEVMLMMDRTICLFYLAEINNVEKFGLPW